MKKERVHRTERVQDQKKKQNQQIAARTRRAESPSSARLVKKGDGNSQRFTQVNPNKSGQPQQQIRKPCKKGKSWKRERKGQMERKDGWTDG